MNKIKKTIILFLLSFSLTPLFAGGWFGFTAITDFNWTTLNDGKPVQIYGKDLIINLDGATYFGSKHQFGLGYGLGLGIPLYTESNGEIQSNKPISFIPKLSFQYRYNINHTFSIEAGLGLNYGMQKFKNIENNITKIKVLNLFANTDIMVHISHLICFRAGIGITSPIYSDFEESNLSILGLSLQPYLGISFCY